MGLAGTLDHFISDHQPIFVVHKKARDTRTSAKFEGRSYRNFNRENFKEKLGNLDWSEFYKITNPSTAWEFIYENITKILDGMCPVRTLNIKNYRPDWMSKELIEQIKDRDYFYKKAKRHGDTDSWNIAKYLRNTVNTNVRKAKREFVLKNLKRMKTMQRSFGKSLRELCPMTKGSLTVTFC